MFSTQFAITQKQLVNGILLVPKINRKHVDDIGIEKLQPEFGFLSKTKIKTNCLRDFILFLLKIT